MFKLSILKILFISMFFFTLVSCETRVGLKALVLTTSNYIQNDDVVSLILQAYGIPFELLAFSQSNLPNGNISLFDKYNHPKFNLIIVNGSLSYKDEETGSWKSSLTKEQWDYLYQYEATYGVREVNISPSVEARDYVKLYKDNEWGRTIDTSQPLIPANRTETKSIFNHSKVKMTAPLDIKGIYHTRVSITNSTYVKPFLYYSENGQEGAVAATLSYFENGREALSFYFSFASWSPTSMILNHLWLMWGTRSVYSGFRRVHFTAHIDDVFLQTKLVDPVNNLMESKDNIYRITPADFEKAADFQKNILTMMPKGSEFKVELAFNGNGILQRADPSKCLRIDGERYVEIEYVKPPGTGKNRWPQEKYSLYKSVPTSTLLNDEVFRYFYNNKTTQQNFYWSSHTFSHENLDEATKADVDNEIRVNLEMADKLGLINKPYFSDRAIITPQISGLHNLDALEMFKHYGIHSATGDLSRKTIINKKNPYLPFFTTLESSNYEGFPIIPRSPTELYYLCSNPTENTWMYNSIYNSHFGRDLTWAEIIERESQRTLLLLMKLRHEAHQFHQANLRFNYDDENNKNKGKSMVEEWTQAVVRRFTQFVDWPLISLKLDDILKSYLRRAQCEASRPEAQIVIDSGNGNTQAKVYVEVKSTQGSGICTVPITVPGKVNEATLPKGTRLEQVGSDPLTVWIELEKVGETKKIELIL